MFNPARLAFLIDPDAERNDAPPRVVWPRAWRPKLLSTYERASFIDSGAV